MKQLGKMAVATLLLATTSSWANGLYLGLAAGPQVADFNQNAHIIIQPPGSTTVDADVVNTVSYSGNGAVGSLFGGYRWNNEKFFFASELNANASSVESDTTNSEIIHSTYSKTTYRMLFSYGLSVLPGFMYGDSTAFYARLGYALGNFRIHTTDASLTNINRYLNGACYGLGIDHLFSTHFGARMEANQTAYQNTNLNVYAGAAHKKTDISPVISQALLSFYYQFS